MWRQANTGPTRGMQVYKDDRPLTVTVLSLSLSPSPFPTLPHFIVRLACGVTMYFGCHNGFPPRSPTAATTHTTIPVVCPVTTHHVQLAAYSCEMASLHDSIHSPPPALILNHWVTHSLTHSSSTGTGHTNARPRKQMPLARPTRSQHTRFSAIGESHSR
jgi:hypothetical protein